MAINFPDAPTSGMIYGGWKWDGSKWVSDPGVYLPLSGGTMLGDLVLAANATLPLGAVTLQQMNNAITAAGLTLPLTVAQGGTGSGTAAGARANLALDRMPIVFVFPNTPIPGAIINIPVIVPFTMAANMPGSRIYGTVNVTAAATNVFRVNKITGGTGSPAQQGQINLAAGPVWTFQSAGTATFAIGDVIQMQYLQGGATAITDLANVGISLYTIRS